MSQSNLEKIIARAEKVKDDYRGIVYQDYKDELWLADTLIGLAKALSRAAERCKLEQTGPEADVCAIYNDALEKAAEGL